jgi:hypothetical protein
MPDEQSNGAQKRTRMLAVLKQNNQSNLLLA